MTTNSQAKLTDTQTDQATRTPDLGQYRVLVIVPAYNEERFIGSVVLKIKQHPVDVLVIDDGSTDKTCQIARAAGAEAHCLPTNQGKGAALNTGFQLARQRQPDAVVVIDADGQHLPEELPRLLAPILRDQADIVIGSRYIDDTSNTPIDRRLGHKLINLATSVPSGIYVSDSQSGFRAFSPRAFDLIQFKSDDFSVESEMQFLAQEFNLRVAEVPITIRYTDGSKRPAVQQGRIVLNGILRLVGQYRPLMYFGVPGMIALLAGIALGIYVVKLYVNTLELAVGYAMITVMLAMAGLLMLSTGITLHSVRALLSDLFNAFSDKMKHG
jgi:glycosyltransferase involved in cell wall biosynthesis